MTNENKVLDPVDLGSEKDLLDLLEMYGVIVAALTARTGELRVSKNEIALLIVNDDKPVIDVRGDEIIVTMLKREEYNALKAQNA
jgi:hypothetical protein